MKKSIGLLIMIKYFSCFLLQANLLNKTSKFDIRCSKDSREKIYEQKTIAKLYAGRPTLKNVIKWSRKTVTGVINPAN